MDDLLWRQLKRDVKQVDSVQQQAVAAYGQAMVPLIKIMEATEKYDKTVNIPFLVSDTFKMLTWNIKQTNLKVARKFRKSSSQNTDPYARMAHRPQNYWGIISKKRRRN